MQEWDVETSASTVGWLTEWARTAGGFVRSDHYSHSCAASGPGAAELVSHHLARVGNRSPWDKEATRWGRTFGDGALSFSTSIFNFPLSFWGTFPTK